LVNHEIWAAHCHGAFRPDSCRSYHLRVTSPTTFLRSPVTLRRLALVSLIANIGIVVTGGAVRLTRSGLGCPTWPKCDDGSYVPTAAMGINGKIEFTNRTLTFVVGVLAVACVIVAWMQARTARRDKQLFWAVAVLLGIPLQAVIGGIVVLADLNPWLVGLHFLASMAVIAAAYQLWVWTREPVAAASTHPMIRSLVWVIVGVTALVLAVGTVVTGSGPHAGDEKAKRTGLDPTMIAQLHTDLVMLLIGLSLAAWFALIATGAARRTANAAALLVAIEAAQALIGFVQYFTHLPIVLVGAHMLGAALVWVGALTLLNAVRPVNVATTVPAQAAAAEPAPSAI
jgi:heme a synthase